MFEILFPVIVCIQAGSWTTEEGLGMYWETTVKRASQVQQGVQG